MCYVRNIPPLFCVHIFHPLNNILRTSEIFAFIKYCDLNYILFVMFDKKRSLGS